MFSYVFVIGVFGENFVGRSQYSLVMVPSKNNSAEVLTITDADKSLKELKEHITGLHSRYNAAMKEYNTVHAEIVDVQQKYDVLMLSRDLSYRSLVLDSIHASFPDHKHLMVGTDSTNIPTDTSSETRLSGSPDIRTTRIRRDSFREVHSAAVSVANKAAETATSVVSSVSSTAHQTVSSYSGWMSKKFAGIFEILL